MDLSKFDMTTLKSLLASSPGSGGLLAVIYSPMSIGAVKSDASRWKLVVDWILSKSVITVRELERPAEPNIINELEIRATIEDALGPSQIVKTETGYASGWNLLSNKRDILEGLVAQAKTGIVGRVANQYRADIILFLGGVCEQFKDQIVDLGSGQTGCGGLLQ